MRMLLIFLTMMSAAFLMTSPAEARRYEEPEITACDPGLGHLQTLRQDEIEAIDESYNISIWVVCPDHPDPSAPLAGNVAGLHSTIARNETLAAALTEAGFDPEQVVAIRFGRGHSLLVYVHRAY